MASYEAHGSPTDERPPGRFDDRDDRRDAYRRRSPADDRRRPPPRNRSRSPVIDRYQPGRDRVGPRDDYYDARANPRDRDDRRRAPSPTPANIDRYVPGQEPETPVVRTNPVTNPLLMDTQAGFSYFAEWWRNEQQMIDDKERAKHGGRRPSDRLRGENESRQDREKERARIQEAYDQYKQDFQVKAARQFVQQHKNEEWFKEHYVPEIRDAIRKRLMEFREGAFEQWKSDMENGVFDEFTLEGIYKQDSDGAGGMIEKEEGEAVGGAETLGVQDLVPAKGGDLKDETMDQPALLIKTLAPNVGRDRIEEFCKDHLGEGEPGGFKWLSLSDPNPTKRFHRIGWIMLNPDPAPAENGDSMEDIKRGEGREDGEEDEKPKSESNAALKALEAINGKTISDPVRGDFVCHVGVHNAPAQPRKKALWDLFSAPERIERDYQLARRLVGRLETQMGKDSDDMNGGLAIIDARVEDMRNKGALQPPPKPPKKNAFADNDDEIKFEDGEELEGDDEEDSEELLVVKKKLDLLVEYLRRVFNFCLFCVFESDSVHELVRKCPGGHLRRPRAGLSKLAKRAAIASANGDPFPKSKDDEGAASPVEERKGNKFNKTEQQLLKAFNWVKTFEEKVLQLLEPEYCDLKKIGGKPVDEALDEELAKFVKQEDEAKFRCKVPECTKLFKAEHFWRKHVEKRHEEWYQGLRNDLELVNTYVLDPSHIAPSRSDANSNGHFPLPPNHQLNNGTPRGFSLQNMISFGQNMANTQLGFVPGMQGADGANGANGHSTGPVRRGGGRFNNRQNPYDKNNRRGYGNMSGMMNQGRMGFIAQGGGGSGGRWGDGAGPPMNMIGPKEAVQGRAIRSYDDLDAQPAGGNNTSGDRAAAAAAAAGDTLDY